jgi:ubiquinone/menaquinone biosynthesis C-methylase UbiE
LGYQVEGRRMPTDSDPRVRLTASYYSAFADSYDALWGPTLLPHSESLLRDLPLEGAHRVLDLGSGTGLLLPAIRSSAPSATVVAVDPAVGMLSRAPTGFPRAVMDGAILALASDSFDVAVMAFVLPHIPDPVSALAEVHRVLRSGGAIGLTTWADTRSSPALELFGRTLDEHGADDPDPAYVCHEAVSTPEKVRALLQAAGFAGVRGRTEPFELRLDLESFMACRTRLGAGWRRLARMSEEARAACVADARARLAKLAPEDFVERDVVNLVVARA